MSQRCLCAPTFARCRSRLPETLLSFLWHLIHDLFLAAERTKLSRVSRTVREVKLKREIINFYKVLRWYYKQRSSYWTVEQSINSMRQSSTLIRHSILSCFAAIIGTRGAVQHVVFLEGELCVWTHKKLLVDERPSWECGEHDSLALILHKDESRAESSWWWTALQQH